MRRPIRYLILAAGMIGLTGCVVEPYHRTYVYREYDDCGVVYVSPVYGGYYGYHGYYHRGYCR